ncbi:MAG: hypothetical protein RL685_1968 [Pseudomonadota bacterium]
MIRSLGWVIVALASAGCGAEYRRYEQPLRTDAGTAPLAATEQNIAEAQGGLALDALAAAPLGAACTAPSDCSSGFCADGVCCRTSCDTVCSRCDGPGTPGECTVSANDAACGLSCPESTDCRGYGSGSDSSNCDAVGLCRLIAECRGQDAPEGTPCESATGSCDGRGECIVPGKTRLGAICATDEDCAEGNCVVGSGGVAICCDSECGGLCQTCSAAGRCNETPRDDGRCNRVDCPDDNLCRDYVDDLDVNLCRSFGQCRTPADCSFSELRAGAQCACAPDGCKLTTGSACTAPGECNSGLCETTVAGSQVCCAQDCASGGLSCSSDGQRCVQCEARSQCRDNVSLLCTDGVPSGQTCGNGCDPATGRCNRERPRGSACDLGAQCQFGNCALDVNGTQRCCDVGCEATGRICGVDGSCVCPVGSQDVAGACQRDLGRPCTQGGECGSGFCAGVAPGGSVCCVQACNGAFCAADGTSCVECAGTSSVCQGTASARCQDGSFVRSACANGCNATTGVCNGLLATGQACTGSTQCGSSVCAPDASGVQRCCATNCATTGRVCATDGSCACPNPSDVFANGACGCPSGTRSCGDARCVANNQCCEACTGGRTCQGGNCACPAGQQFINGQCRLNLGAACSSTGTPCGTGLCVDGVCCESTCDGLCMQCQAGSGRCVMPADDAGCGAIRCSASSSCQQTSDITTNRCQAVGQCKTPASCSFSNRPSRTACGPGANLACGSSTPCLATPICDAGGVCRSPTVTCAGTNQEVSATACCSFSFIEGPPESFTNACSPGSEGSITGWCDNTTDCPLGSVCCLADNGNFDSIACTTSCAESGDPLDPSGSGEYIVCRSPSGGSSACPGSRPCSRTHPEFPAWGFCRFP